MVQPQRGSGLVGRRRIVDTQLAAHGGQTFGRLAVASSFDLQARPGQLRVGGHLRRVARGAWGWQLPWRLGRPVGVGIASGSGPLVWRLRWFPRVRPARRVRRVPGRFVGSRGRPGLVGAVRVLTGGPLLFLQLAADASSGVLQRRRVGVVAEPGSVGRGGLPFSLAVGSVPCWPGSTCRRVWPSRTSTTERTFPSGHCRRFAPPPPRRNPPRPAAAASPATAGRGRCGSVSEARGGSGSGSNHRWVGVSRGGVR